VAWTQPDPGGLGGSETRDMLRAPAPRGTAARAMPGKIQLRKHRSSLPGFFFQYSQACWSVHSPAQGCAWCEQRSALRPRRRFQCRPKGSLCWVPSFFSSPGEATSRFEKCGLFYKLEKSRRTQAGTRPSPTEMGDPCCSSHTCMALIEARVSPRAPRGIPAPTLPGC